MQVILFLLGLFAIGCVLYGISAGVQIIQRAVSALVKGSHLIGACNEPHANHLAVGPACASVEPPDVQTRPPQSEASSNRSAVGEIRTLFELHQKGALTVVEFEGLKRSVLASISASDNQSNLGTR